MLHKGVPVLHLIRIREVQFLQEIIVLPLLAFELCSATVSRFLDGAS